MGIDIKSTNIQQIIQQELTRKQFVQLLGALIISILGFDNILKLLSKANRTESGKNAASGEHGFGSSKFGI